jgi:ABC-type nitrate/sulfonate/bicarbonate transport system substrate-binding protein
VTGVALAGLAVAAPVSSQTKTVVRVGYIPSDSFAAVYIMADRHPPAADVAVETVRLSGGSEILSQVATGQLNMGGTGMGAAGFNAVAASLPVEFVAPLHSRYVEDYFTVRKASWEKESKLFWNKDWAAKNPELAHKVMVAYVKAARDLALDNGWKQERNIDLMVKYTGAKADVIRRARAHVLDPNLDMDPEVLDSISPTATAPSPSSARSSSR